MKLIKSAVCAALVSTSLIATPAVSQVSPTVQTALNDYCRVSVVPPGDPGSPPFVITAINILQGATTGGGVTNTVVGSDFHRNGGSPNIFVTATVTVTGASTEYTFDCQTFNPNASDNGNGQYPTGLQFTGVSTSIAVTQPISYEIDVVACNSPGRNPGTWRGQNGFSDTTCATQGEGFYNLPISNRQTNWNPIPSNSLPQ